MAPTISIDSSGIWGSPTSTLDWCEKNYQITIYIAEFWNTITNLSMIVPALYGLSNVLRQGLERRYLLCFVLLFITGVGSWMFHMTLLYEMQLMDELPMVWGASYFVYCQFRANHSYEDGGRRVAVIMTCYSLLVSIVYLVNKNPIFHEFMYGILVITTLVMAIRLNHKQYSKSAALLFYGGMLMYGVGFILWNIDNMYCSKITDLREKHLNPSVGIFQYLSPFTQLHGWWHLFAGYATYLHIINCIQQRLNFLKIDYSFRPSFFVGVNLELHPVQRLKLLKSKYYQD